jgi:ribosomal-protein-alanine N-acetyltransferase
MDLSDEPQVRLIEDENFEFAWTEEDFEYYRKKKKCVGCVAKFQGKIVGFMIFELLKTRIHVVNFAVAKNFQRMGVGRCLVKNLYRRLSTQQRTRILLEVRERNLAAQLFFRKMGFKAILPLKNYYPDLPDEDAYLMQYRLYKEPLKPIFFSFISKITNFLSRMAT